MFDRLTKTYVSHKGSKRTKDNNKKFDVWFLRDLCVFV